MGVYNCASTLQKAIDSIRNQTYTNWEFIICDDGSTDGSLQIIQRNADEDERIHVLRNSVNLRLAATLNHCLSVATGDYVARMDADDESAPERFAEQVRFLNENTDVACVGSSLYVMDGTCQSKIRRCTEFPNKGMMLFRLPFAHPTIMMRREVYAALGGYAVSRVTERCEDADLWFRFYAAGYKGYNIQTPLYYYKETADDYDKRTVRAAANAARVYFAGNRMLGVPWWKLVCCLKPMVSAILPRIVMRAYHRMRDKNV